jgi:hypothetical protein
MMQGLKRVVRDPEFRKEVVAGGIWQYLVSRRFLSVCSLPLFLKFVVYKQCADSVGEHDRDFHRALSYHRQATWSLRQFLGDPLSELPQVGYQLIQHPKTI